ncbi:hypothetical protein ZWY2020_031925 [Hordeum vulgare]|nr:hypothetical protein ZWY2020_031925 [Hordeum vulgare]
MLKLQEEAQVEPGVVGEQARQHADTRLRGAAPWVEREASARSVGFTFGKKKTRISSNHGAPSGAALNEFLFGVSEDTLKDHSEFGGPRVAFASSVWTDLTCPLKTAYRHAVVSKRKAGASTVDFANNPEAARRQINAWVAEVTGNLISPVLGRGSITKLTRVVLGNMIYFKGQWEDPFDKEATVGDGELKRSR